jgi:hypothetical protein
MGRPLAIPRILGIEWWTLLIAGMFEYWLRILLHVPPWVPWITGLWMLGQAVWLRLAEAKSIAIYIDLVALVMTVLANLINSTWSGIPVWARVCLGISAFGVWITGRIVFRYEMERHFTETDPRGVSLSMVMTVCFGELYFQYWFHQIYLEQNQVDVQVTQ